MRALVQRVSRAAVRVEGRTAGAIGEGMLILLGIRKGDTEQDLIWTAEKCANLRIFSDSEGKFNYSLLDTGGSALVVSQFTLCGDCSRGRRPGFSDAEVPERAESMVSAFIEHLRSAGVPVQTGVFGAMMEVELVNSGPVTLMVERPQTA